MEFRDSRTPSPSTDLTIDWISLEKTRMERKMKLIERPYSSIWRALVSNGSCQASSIGTGVR